MGCRGIAVFFVCLAIIGISTAASFPGAFANTAGVGNERGGSRVASPLQPLAGKLPPVPRAGFAAGNEGGRGAREARYVHKIGVSPKAFAWSGSSAEGREWAHRNKRDQVTRQVVNSLIRCGREKQAKSLATCGEWFDVWAKASGEVKLLPCPCDSIFCPDCAHRRAAPLIQKLAGLVNKRGCSYWFLTLTVPNVENILKWDIAQISEQFAKLWDSWVFQEWEDENRQTFRIFGGVRSIECVYEPESKSWHPHVHVLFEAPSRLPGWWLVLLKHAWTVITGDARYLHLQRAYSVTRRGKRKYNRLNAKALRELVKYVTKCAEFAGDHFLVDEFLTAFKRVRRIQCFGSFHGKVALSEMREPGDDTAEISREAHCMTAEGFRRLPFRARIADTVVRSDGVRQLVFDFAQRVREYIECADPPWELTPAPVVLPGQKRIGFAGAMPGKSAWQSSLFEVAA